MLVITFRGLTAITLTRTVNAVEAPERGWRADVMSAVQVTASAEVTGHAFDCDVMDVFTAEVHGESAVQKGWR